MTLLVPVAMRAHVHSEHKLGVTAPVGLSTHRGTRRDADGFLVSSFTYVEPKPAAIDWSAGGFPGLFEEPPLSHAAVCKAERRLNSSPSNPHTLKEELQEVGAWFGMDFGSLEERVIANLTFPSGYMWRPKADVIGFAVNGSPTGREVNVQKARQEGCGMRSMTASDWAKRHLTIDKVDAQELLDRVRSEQEDVFGYMAAIHDELIVKHLSVSPVLLDLPKEQRVASNFVEQGEHAAKVALKFAKETVYGVAPRGLDVQPLRKGIEINVERKPAASITVDMHNMPKDCVGYEVRNAQTGERTVHVTVGDIRSDAKPANFEPMKNWRDTIPYMHPELDSVVGRSYRPLGRFASRSLYVVFNIERRVNELWSADPKGNVAKTVPKYMTQYDPDSPFGEALRRAYDDGMFKGLPVYPPSDNRAYRL